MHRILTLLDGSAYSESVCHHTAWFARKLGAGVEAMHVLGRREGAASSDLSGTLRLGARAALLDELTTLDEQRARLARARGQAILDDARAILDQAGVPVVNTRLYKGDLLDAVREVGRGVRGITIGKRGERADFASGHLGSNLERIVRMSEVPVFVASREFRPVSKVLLAYDASASAWAAVDRMASSPVFSDLEICVLCAGPDEALALITAQEGVLALQTAGLSATSRAVVGEPDEVLNRVVTDEGFDLLVMGAYGHSRIRSLIIGSTTTAMIRSVKIPVLLFR
ncbi:MAG: universal stress protein UspA [Rhodobacteraceae bacterium]|nr:universal stress protein UspA [Paracoccaceae bacterium]